MRRSASYSTATRHTPMIGSDYAGCRCTHWSTTRDHNETQGQFTIRAYTEYQSHLETPQPPLFTMSEFLMEDARR